MTGERIMVTGGSGFVGINLVDSLVHDGFTVLNVDVREPRCTDHADYFLDVDILNAETLRNAVMDFGPQKVVHLAARTDLDGTSLQDYSANTVGVRNLVEVLAGAKTVKRCVFVSTKLVCKNDYVPSSWDDYCPDTIYGQSKVAGERIVKESDGMQCEWCLARLTGIWGPWFGEPYRHFFEMIARGSYLHPGGTDAPKSFGYVGNIVFQLRRLLEAEAEKVHRQTFYLSDYEPYTIRKWADHISRLVGGKKIRSIPARLMTVAGCAGDFLKRMGVKNPPVTSFRLNNMRADTSRIPLQPVRAIASPLPFSLEEGVRYTLEWMRKQNIIS